MEDNEKDIMKVVKTKLPDGLESYQARVDGNLEDIFRAVVLAMQLLMENCQPAGKWEEVRNELAANLFSDFQHFEDKANHFLFEKLMKDSFGKKED